MVMLNTITHFENLGLLHIEINKSGRVLNRLIYDVNSALTLMVVVVELREEVLHPNIHSRALRGGI